MYLQELLKDSLAFRLLANQSDPDTAAVVLVLVWVVSSSVF